MMFQTYHLLVISFSAVCLLAFHNIYRHHHTIHQLLQQQASPVHITATLPPRQTKSYESSLLPSPLSTVYHLQRTSENVEFLRNYSYSRPLALATYIRDVDHDPDLVELSFFLTGISLAKYQRNLSAVACRVGNVLFASDLFRDDFLRCHVNRSVLIPGVVLSPILLLDQVLQRALEGPVKLNLELVANFQPGDVMPLPTSVQLDPQLENLGYMPEDLMEVRSPHVFDTQYDRYAPKHAGNKPRYEVCMATQIKPSTYLLPDWIDYHRRLGVDMVYIFDNHAEEDLSLTYEGRSDVEVVYWPFERSQVQAFVYSMIALRARCEWLLGIDADEYVMIGLGEGDEFTTGPRPLKQYIWSLAGKFSEISFQWVLMRNSDYEKRPLKAVPEAYTHRTAKLGSRALRKTVASTDEDWIGASPHFRISRRPHRVFRDKTGDAFPREPYDVAKVVHYIHRSWEEYQEKVRAGRANIMNQRSISSILDMQRLGDEDNKKKYMRHQAMNREVYTHFRDIWRRVKLGLSNDESVTAWTAEDGMQCRATFSNKDNAGHEALHKDTSCTA